MSGLRKLLHFCGRVVRRSRYEAARLLMPKTAVLGPKIVPRIEGPLVEQQRVKLHLGCGPMHLDGYINIDQDVTACADLYFDFRDIEQAFKRGSITEVLMVHSLSYLNLWQARELFASVLRLLEPGGRLIVELPDLGKCAAHLLASEGDTAAYLEGVRGVYAFDLSQVVHQLPITPYAFGWSQWHLREELEKAGYASIQVLPPAYHEQPWRDIRVEASKGR